MARSKPSLLIWPSGFAPLPPRAFPYGVGDGYLYESGAGQRWMLLLGPGPALSLYAPPRSRNRR